MFRSSVILHSFSTVLERISSPNTTDLSLIDLEFDAEDDDVEELPDEVPKLLELRCDVSLNPPSSAMNVNAPRRVYPTTRTQTPRLEKAEDRTDEGQKQQQHQDEPLLRRGRLFPLLQQIPRRRLQQPLVEDADDGDDGGEGGVGWWVW
ncbi:hypothetical protein L798_00529 [Zootermopsis nevadensis]|uniref:Uncharacterized protein n=1 Tax=Zootermopsis nevadensis TaxID=136037 RepID=A0A067QKG5_ZOONE|nr:hypothetical protein L798_00529 [Zootermopsis nevadensis]